MRYLSEAECVRLVNACEPAFRNLVRGALLTGCRYSELTAYARCGFQRRRGRRHGARKQGRKASPRRPDGRRAAAVRNLTAGKLGRRSDFHPRRRWRVGQVAPIAANAGGLQESENQAGDFISRAPPHSWLDARHARRSDGRHRRTAWPCRHADDRKTLCAPCAILRRRHDPRAFSNAWNCRGKLCDAHATGGLKGISGP